MRRTALFQPKLAAKGDDPPNPEKNAETLEERRSRLADLVGRLLASQWSKRVLCSHSPEANKATDE
jgi:hypothetical protein